MKLSEVIKAIEDGSKNEFSLNGYNEKIKKSTVFNNVIVGCYPFPIYGWEEVKPPRQWSEKELMLFKLLPDWANWITKDKFGCYICSEKPSKLENSKSFKGNGGKVNSIEMFDFLTITFEESPIYIGDLKGE